MMNCASWMSLDNITSAANGVRGKADRSSRRVALGEFRSRKPWEFKAPSSFERFYSGNVTK